MKTLNFEMRKGILMVHTYEAERKYFQEMNDRNFAYWDGMRQAVTDLGYEEEYESFRELQKSNPKITVKEALEKFVDSMNMTDEEYAEKYGDDEPETGEHGKLIDYIWEPYHDVMIYEDGYESRMNIGD